MEAWSQSLIPHLSHANGSIKGFVCIQHFCDDNIIRTKSKGHQIKKNALPTVFKSNQMDDSAISSISSDDNIVDFGEADNIEQPMKSPKQNYSNQCVQDGVGVSKQRNQSCDICGDLFVENKGLRLDLAKQQADENVRVAKLENRIKQLQSSIDIQKDHIRFLNKKFLRAEKSEQALQRVLEELKEQEILSGDALETLKVCNQFGNTRNASIRNMNQHPLY